MIHVGKPAALATFVLGGLLPLLPAGGAAAAETVLVSAGSSMVYRANSASPGVDATWMNESFSPSGWSSGSYGVGYETSAPGAAALIATSVSSSSLSVYTRTTFSVADLASVFNVYLGADYDDGYVAWINGVEVYRSAQMPAGSPTWNQTGVGLHESSNAASPNYGTLQNISAAALPALHDGSNVLAIGVWNSGTGSSDLVLVPRLSTNLPSTTVTRGPYLQSGTPSSVIVRWRTSGTTDSCVRYGSAPGSLTSSACDAANTTEHVVSVSGLSADTRYYYSIGTSGEVLAGDSSDTFFTTSPAVGVPHATRIWAIGDSGTADANAAHVRDAYEAFSSGTSTDLWLMLGDNAYSSGTDSDYQSAVFNTYPSMLKRSVLWPTFGNHDAMSADSATQSGTYYNIFSLPTAAQAGGLASGTEAYYSFDYGDIHFVCLDSAESSRLTGGAMLNWLTADLEDTLQPWIIAFFHHPPYSKGSHDSDVESELVQMRQNALPILESHGVDLVLTGHSHSYERSFFLDGHYGASSTLQSSMKLDAGDGRIDGDGAYAKTGGGPVADEGAVYVVAGSSGKTEAGGSLDHPAMFLSLLELGSLVIDVDGAQMDVTFLDDTGASLDHFSIVKTTAEPVCGNGIVESGEECDDGNAVSTDACVACRNATCGDGFVHAGVEQCDDANASNTDACLGSCQNATCGDGFVHVGVEQCDDGNADDGDGCLTSCVLPGCGDGIVNVGVEQCDDGNADDTDGCLSTCQDASCGDGFVRAGVEQCDDANGVDTDDCLSDCTNATCGDGFVHAGVEDCDDANGVDTDDCLSSCVNASCGDGFVHAGVEDCDDANAVDTDACPSSCTPAYCGDAFVESGTEQCDDGNDQSGDGCSQDCLIDCAAQPRSDCREAGKSILKITKAADPAKSRVKWKWLRGPAIAADGIGDPTLDAGYNLCFYPNVPGAGSPGAEVLLAPASYWLADSAGGYAYRDPSASNGGVSDLQIGIGAVRKTRVRLRASGAELPSGLLPATSYTLQLVDGSGSSCWSSSFTGGTSTPTLFKGRTLLP